MALSGPRLRACPVLWGLIEECKKQKMELLTEKKIALAAKEKTGNDTSGTRFI